MRALLAVSALLAFALPAWAADTPMTAAQIRDLARRDTVWCENYRPDKKDCETLTIISLLPDGSLRETAVMRLAKSPDLKMVMDGRSAIQGNSVCSVFGDTSVRLGFLLNDRPVPSAAAGAIETAVRETMAEFEGKTFCQTFYRGASDAEVSETITVDGERRQDLESVYRIQSDETGLDIRAAEPDAEEATI